MSCSSASKALREKTRSTPSMLSELSETASSSAPNVNQKQRVGLRHAPVWCHPFAPWSSASASLSWARKPAERKQKTRETKKCFPGPGRLPPSGRMPRKVYTLRSELVQNAVECKMQRSPGLRDCSLHQEEKHSLRSLAKRDGGPGISGQTPHPLNAFSQNRWINASCMMPKDKPATDRSIHGSSEVRASYSLAIHPQVPDPLASKRETNLC